MPFEDWKWFKAQGMAESNLNPLAVSPMGAKGIMQLMDRTSKDLGVTDVFDPESNIQAGIKYDSWLWKWLKGEGDRRRKMFASYNWGIGNVKKMCLWGMDRLPKETRDYILRIETTKWRIL